MQTGRSWTNKKAGGRIKEHIGGARVAASEIKSSVSKYYHGELQDATHGKRNADIRQSGKFRNFQTIWRKKAITLAKNKQFQIYFYINDIGRDVRRERCLN